ncbi:MAG: succinate dehydrogenase cytochrome b subunit [Rikenellaceae bacterium]|nr:succinate dehydrogenase cytochrome b subunit [Rikenellaceae bacterium]
MSFLWKSSIGRKLVMSVTGICFILFLLFHMAMNLVSIFSPAMYNVICTILGANWYTLIATGVLAAGFFIHILYAFYLTLQNRKARGVERYAAGQKNPGYVTWASKNMLVLGLIVLGGLLIHLFNFWAKMQLVEVLGGHENSLGFHPTNGAALILYTFSNIVYVIIYLIWLGALWFHMAHGFWSALQTIGWTNTVWLSRVKCLSTILATIICLGFAAVVVFYFAVSLGCGGACGL